MSVPEKHAPAKADGDQQQTAVRPAPRKPEKQPDMVEEASLGSFPASDPPSWIWGALRFR